MAKTTKKKTPVKAVTKKVTAKKSGKKTEKVTKKEPIKSNVKAVETVTETKSVPATTPNFNADIAKTVAKPATTITPVNTDRKRRIIATQETPQSVNNIAELERIFQSTYRKANSIQQLQAFQLEAWIKKLNPEADVLVLRPRKDVRVQAAFQVTIGEDTRRMPETGFWSTGG